MSAPELVPLGTMTVTLGPSHPVKNGPMGTRVIAEVATVDIEGDRLNASLCSPAAADWLTIAPDRSYGTLDVRLTLKTDDDEIIQMEYSGRIDMGAGVAVSAPLFQTGAERYDWLNRIQAIGVGQNSPEKLVYELFEVRPS